MSMDIIKLVFDEIQALFDFNSSTMDSDSGESDLTPY